MKKFTFIAFAILMVLAVSTAALADGAAMTNHGGTDSSNEVARILKELTVYNPENCTVNEPTISYSYSIAGVDTGNTVTYNSITVTVKEGVTTGLTMKSQTNATAAAGTTLTYAPGGTATLTANSTGTQNTKWIDIDFSGVNFGSAGIFRYLITETPGTYGSTGVVEGSTGHNRYLDVYVKDASTQTATLNDPADWEVYGYSLFTADESLTTSNNGTNSTGAYKTTGFVADSDYSKTADEYYTYNVTITKALVGDAAMKSHQFPLDITFSNTTVTANVLPIVAKTGTATIPTSIAAGAVSDFHFTESNVKIADGGSISITGIPAGTTVTVKEKNDVTGTTYLTKTEGGLTNVTEAAVLAGNWTGNATGMSKTANTNAKAEENHTIAFTNTLSQISPTGYIARYAPYGLMLIGGIALLLIAKRHRRHPDEEE